MNDTVIKGTHNSRSILGAADIPETWADARAQLIANGWPIDLGPLNPLGCLQVGTGYTKAEVLSDETAEKIGLEQKNPTINNAFNGVLTILEMMQADKAYVRIKVRSSNGIPVSGVLINGLSATLKGGDVYTDNSGTATGYINAGMATISISDYLDIADKSETISAVSGKFYNVELIVETRNFLLITSTRNCKISSLTERVDVTVVGGGKSGETAPSSRNSGKGGDGGPVIVKENVKFTKNQQFQAIVGAANGGISSFLSETTAGKNGVLGGKGSIESATDSALAAPGRGTNGPYGFSSFTETTIYGSSGGGGGSNHGNSSGLLSYPNGAVGGNGAGKGGKASQYESGNKGDDATNYGCAGGGGAIYYTANYGPHKGAGGDGMQGCIAVRMYLKEAA